ncbi:hypothetical protein IFM89_029328 [Coptis chinensis]|uniref:Uncharacterized protein n=1 Tax=Coptis chinensis TaxID=261450 RepID=A0A835MCH7_9MAGN|nr:hypothetical protein IFM89_029328 [Coptis chinensis]
MSLGREEDAKACMAGSTRMQTGMMIAKSLKLAAEAKLLCREIAAHVEFYGFTDYSQLEVRSRSDSLTSTPPTPPRFGMERDEVIKHPQVLLNIQNELDSIVGGNRMVTESDLPHLNYLRFVVRETF